MREGSEPVSSRPRVAIFGGSFDPIHRGHLAMAAAARETLALEGVVFVPCAVSPFKSGTIASGRDRLRMVEIAVEDAGMEWASVSDYEVDRPGPSYSWETTAHFSQTRPDVEWCWILGTDQWDQIEAWAEPQRLRTSLHFVVFTREGEVVADRPGWRYTAVSFEHPASSTAIRSDFEGRHEWLTEGVRAYCERAGIYLRKS